MKFGRLRPAEALGASLAYPMHGLKKGAKLRKADIVRLQQAGVDALIAARLDAKLDIDENEAARKLAKSAAGSHIKCVIAHGGRTDLHATQSGLLVYDPRKLMRANSVDEACTLAALPPYARIGKGERLGSVKIIPLGLARTALQRAVCRAEKILTLHPFRPLRAILIHTSLPHSKPSLRTKAERISRARLAEVGTELTAVHHCPHNVAALAETLAACSKTDLLLVHSAQAIIDRRDIVPAALRRAGGRVLHFGMPVEPGNLLLFGKRQAQHVIGLPGCARSPKRNGLDWVLERLAARLPLGRKEIRAMGAGGLLP